MTEVSFYRAGSRKAGAAAWEILQARLAKGRRTVVRLPEEDSLRRFDNWLWTYGEDSFLPHGTKADGHAERQPIYLTCEAGVPNEADLLLLLDGAEASVEEIGALPAVAVVFDREQAGPARKLWNACSAADLNPVLWERDDAGRWQRHVHKNNDEGRVEDGH